MWRLAALLTSVLLAAAPALQARPALGTNLSAPADWSTDYPFLNLFKMSRPWISGTPQEWKDERSLDLDERGWVKALLPGQVARTVVLSGIDPRSARDISGRYVVDYRGKGKLEYEGCAVLIERKQGRDLIEVSAETGKPLVVLLTGVDAADPLRDIVLYREGIDPGKILNPRFVESLRPFRLVRFMDWMGTNNSAQMRWADRPRMDDARWSGGRGVPLEVMAMLANTLGADAWFSMPHLADDDYVRRFARLAARVLEPRLRIYVEHSNEAWNRVFKQARHAEEQGLRLKLDRDPRVASAKYHGMRSAQIFDLWSREIAPPRLVRVLATQATSTRWTEAAIAHGGVAPHTDALAIAPYFGLRGDEYATVRSMAVDDFMRWLRSNALPRARTAMERQAEIARRYKLSLIAYEGGQHLVAVGRMMDDAALNALFDAANRHPMMRELYGAYLDDWVAAGGGALVHFNNCGRYRKSNRFGALEYLGQPRQEAPKHDALLRYLERS